MHRTPLTKFSIVLGSVLLLSTSSFGMARAKKANKHSKPVMAKPVTKPPNAAKQLKRHKAPKHANSFVPAGGRVGSGPWKEPTFADSTIGDKIDGEDLVVRRAAV